MSKCNKRTDYYLQENNNLNLEEIEKYSAKIAVEKLANIFNSTLYGGPIYEYD